MSASQPHLKVHSDHITPSIAHTWVSTHARGFGLFAGLLAAVAFSCMNLLVLKCDGALHPAQFMAARGVTGVVLLLPFVLRRLPAIFERRSLPMWLQCGAGALAAYALYQNVEMLGIGEAVALSYLAPVFAAMAVPLVFHEKMHRRQALGVLFMLAGVVWLHCLQTRAVSVSTLAIGLAGAVFGGCAMLALRVAARLGAPMLSAWLFCLSALVASPLFEAPALWPEPSQALWRMLLGVGLLATAGQVFLTLSFLWLPVILAATLCLSTFLVSVVLESAATHVWPTMYQACAYGVIFAGLVVLQLAPAAPRTPSQDPRPA